MEGSYTLVLKDLRDDAWRDAVEVVEQSRWAGAVAKYAARRTLHTGADLLTDKPTD